MELRSPEAMRKLVEAGLGVSFLPRLTVQEALQSGALLKVEVRGVAFEREIGIAWRRGRYFGQAVRLLLESVFSVYGGREEWLSKITVKR